jgi:hypothetical protein
MGTVASLKVGVDVESHKLQWNGTWMLRNLMYFVSIPLMTVNLFPFQLRIKFNDAATTMFEYPSEASLLDETSYPPSGSLSSQAGVTLPTSPGVSIPLGKYLLLWPQSNAKYC